MNIYIKPTLLVLFTLSIFVFGWISRGIYTPSLKLSEDIPIEIVRVIETPAPKKPSLLDKIKNDKTLNVVLLNTLSTYYIGTDGKQGFEYDLLKSYADSLGVELNITTAQTTKEAIELSKKLEIHITSASLAKTPLREKSFNFGPSYAEIQEQVVCYRGMEKSKKFPRDIENLSGVNIVIGEDTSYSETVQSLRDDSFDINATLTSKFSSEELLAKVASHEIDCTIVDSNIYAMNLKYFPEISLAFTISEREQLAWVLADGSKELKADMYSWFNNFNQSGAMAELKDHYYNNVLFFDYYNTKVFYKRVESRLPKYQKFFENAGKYYGIPWRLLASISYQESHWNPK
ncbi:MAG: transporter substrate-binding domain-containing protein, partial [Campylobacterota bacterium]|nr:transporter substrate-binding domain-containing protein [Campylobacterota bacterium]